MNVRLLKTSIHYLKKDKICLLLSFAPVMVSSLIFYFLWKYVVFDLADWLKSLIGVSETSWWLFAYLISFVIAFLAAFILSWFFSSIVSLVSSPFLDVISSRIEKLHLGREMPSIGDSFKTMIGRLSFILRNEFLKIGVVLVVSSVSFLMNQTLILAPFAYFLSAVVFSYTYLDYSFSRVNMKSRDCTQFMRKRLVSTGIAGMVFLFLVSIPIINLFFLPISVAYYTLYFVENISHEEKNTVEASTKQT